jgi:hypothetical protein
MASEGEVPFDKRATISVGRDTAICACWSTLWSNRTIVLITCPESLVFRVIQRAKLKTLRIRPEGRNDIPRLPTSDN